MSKDSNRENSNSQRSKGILGEMSGEIWKMTDVGLKLKKSLHDNADKRNAGHSMNVQHC